MFPDDRPGLNRSGGKYLASGALRLCAECLVVPECLDYALATNQEFGVWGGMTPTQREDHAREKETVSV